MRDSNIKIPIIAALVVAVVSLGVAFAAFSTQLNINGTATVQASSWDIFFTTAASGGSKPESSTNMPSGTITPSGSVSDATASILATTFTWSANFKSPNDKVVYTIYVKNGGDYNAKVSNISMPTITCTGDTKSACTHLHYGLFTDSTGVTPLSTAFQVNAGATETFYLVAYLDDTYGGNDGSGLVSTDLTTDSISATVTFEQISSAVTPNNSGNSGGNSQSGGNTPSGNPFVNTDGAYYTYEGKSFIGTGVSNVIISETIISQAEFSSDDGVCAVALNEFDDCPIGANPRYVFVDSPAADAAAAYCTECRLMTVTEALSWDSTANYDSSTKRIGKYNGGAGYWWLGDTFDGFSSWIVNSLGEVDAEDVIYSNGVRPAVSISNTATMIGSGTQGSPYVITDSN